MKGNCPHCGKPVQIILDSLRINPIFEQGEFPIDRWKATLSPQQLTILDIAERNGLLDSLEMALTAINIKITSTTVERFFLNWIKTSIERKVPTFVTITLKKEFPNANTISYSDANGVGAILVDNKIRWFFPSISVVGTKSGLRSTLPIDKTLFNEWIRTKRGYVAFDGALYSELHTASIDTLIPLDVKKLKAFQGGLISTK